MKVPRDLGGEELAKLLERYEYRLTRQTGSHLRLTSTLKGAEHHVSIPRHKALKVGTLNNIVNEVATYLELEKQALMEALFKG